MKPEKIFNHETHELHEKQMAFVCFVVLFLAVTGVAQQVPLGHATDFTSRSYFEPPNEQKVKMKLTGKEASPLPGGLLEVKRLQIESFDLTGKTNAIIEAPQCIYSPLDGVANSAGHITMRTSDGKLHVEGDGFLWRQTDNSLTISNNVNTRFQSGVLRFNGP